MAVISTPNASSVKVKWDHGTDLNGDRVIKSRTYGSIKFDADNDKVMATVLILDSLQEHVLSGTTRIDSHSLSE